MNFKDIYDFAREGKAASGKAPVSVSRLAAEITARHTEIGEIHFWPAKIDEHVILGYMTDDYDRDSSREEEFRILDIKYSNSLNFCWRRLVCCKELMHSFDHARERTNSRGKFERLLSELESPPMTDDFSPMLSSEFRAEWMALVCLCPKPSRDKVKARLEAGEISELEAATEFRVPELMMRAIVSPYYETALDDFLD